MRKLPLTGKNGRGKFALVDNKDYDRAIKVSENWAVNSEGYPVAGGRKKKFLMHRLIMNFPVDRDVHHKNGDSLDNRKRNLQALKRSDHAGLSKRGATSKFHGVCLGSDRKWMTRLTLCRFESEEDAARASNIARLLFRGNSSIMNKVPQGGAKWKKIEQQLKKIMDENPDGIFDAVVYKGGKVITDETREALSRANQGAKNHHAKLSETCVTSIRSNWDNQRIGGRRIYTLTAFSIIMGKKYGVCTRTIRCVVQGQTWKHLTLCARGW